MKSRDDIKRELEAIQRDIAALGAGQVSPVGHVRLAGLDGETRPLGVYYDADGVTVVVPPDRSEPSEEELRRYFPGERPRLWILLGPERVQEPIEEALL